jgi:hypothetical protein
LPKTTKPFQQIADFEVKWRLAQKTPLRDAISRLETKDEKFLTMLNLNDSGNDEYSINHEEIREAQTKMSFALKSLSISIRNFTFRQEADGYNCILV